MEIMHRICIDPGHGGRDPGAVGPTGLRESFVTLEVSLDVAALLAPLAQVTMTRQSDETVALDVRARIANNAGANICVSIHCNAAEDRSATGIEAFHHPNSSEGQRLANAILKLLIAATGQRNRGVKTATFAMVRLPKMPAALVELPFISNPADEKLLADPGFRRTCARAIAQGIADYLGLSLQEGAADMPFVDTKGHWAEKDIDQAADWGLLAVPADKRFRPNDTISRAEIVVLLVRTVRFVLAEVRKMLGK